MRFLRRSGSQDRYWRPALKDAGPAQAATRRRRWSTARSARRTIRNGLNVGVDLKGTGSKALIGYRALKFADVLDVEKRGPQQARLLGADPRQQGRSPDPRARRVLHPGLQGAQSRCRPTHAAEMVADRPDDGRVPRPLRRLLRSGLRLRARRDRRGPRRCWRCARTRSRSCWRTARSIAPPGLRGAGRAPRKIYGQGIASNYQGQGLKLSKHFR